MNLFLQTVVNAEAAERRARESAESSAPAPRDDELRSDANSERG